MKRKNIVRRVIATLAVCAMTITSLPAVAMAEEPQTKATEEGLVLHYDFESLESGTIVNDVSGNPDAKAGVVRPTGSEVRTQTDLILGEERTSFVLNGGQPDATHTYVEMPQGVLNGLEDATISCWVYLNVSDAGYRRIWDFGSNQTSYMYLLADGNNDGKKGYTTAITASGWSDEKGPQKGTSLETGRWIYTTVTFDGSEKKLSLYEDGNLIGTDTTDVDLSALQGTTKNMIGYGQFENELLNGRIADFKVYNYAMTPEQVKAQITLTDEEKVARDKNTLSLGDTSAVTENMTLPEVGSAGAEITWESNNQDVLANDGTITRPAATENDVTVTLTATISSGDVEDTKSFEVTVKRQLTAKETAEADAESIDLGNIGSVKENMVLPTKGKLGSTITWESSNEEILSSTGIVKRPETETKVNLTATVTFEGEQATKVFEVTVMPSYTQIKIKEVKPVNVTSYVGKLPNLPATVSVVYDNDTTGTEKAVWPTDLNVSDFQEAGNKQITGMIVGTDVEVTANVTVQTGTPEAPEKVAESFDLSDIRLNGTDTIYGQNAARAFEYLKIMDADRMLYNFRKTFGQDTKGAQPLGGWEAPDGLLRGHSTGHFMSALAIAYASTGDEAYKTKLDYMVEEMAKLQEMSKGDPSEFKTACSPTDAAQSKWSKDPSTWGEGFISAYSPDQFALLEQYTPYATIWAPYYTLHKLFAGFIDSYTYAGNETGLEIAKKLGLWVYDRLSALTPEQRTNMWAMYIAGEYGGMNEVLAKLYEITKAEDYPQADCYLEASKMFDNTVFFDGLANNVDTIQDRHANQHIPQIVGAVHEYAASGEQKYYDIAQNFWEMTTSRYAYSIGGVGTGERFKEPYRQGNNILGNAGRGENCETCAAYNLLKLTMDLYNYNPDDASYMDYYERTLINQILASQSQETTEWMHNGVTYMLPIDPGQRRGYDSDYGSFTCCNGTGMENHVKYQAAAYAHTADTLYVNLYMPTTVNWEEKQISVTQETKFPSESSKLTVSGNGEFTMKLRVPYWATEGFTVRVNGEEPVCTEPPVSSYVEITRTWSDGDVVTIEMPYTLHLDKTPDKVDESTVASLMYGPLVMVAKDQNTSYTPMNWYNIVLSNKLSESVEVVTAPGQDSVPKLTTNGLEFFPMYDAYNYRYHAYLKIDEAGAPLDRSKLEALIAQATGEDAPKKEDYSPKSYREFQAALSAAQEAVVLDPTTQSQINKALKALQDAINGLKPAVTPDQNNLSASADVTVSYCSAWETIEALNDGKTGSASLGSDCSHWGTWGNWDTTEEWAQYEWARPVYIDRSEVYFFDNSNGGDGGVQTPGSYRIEYLNEEGTWTAVSNPQGLGTNQDAYNVTTFDPVQTTGIRVVLVKKEDAEGGRIAVGLNEWKVSGTAPAAEELLADFNFDTDGEFFEGGNAKADGSYELVEHDNGKALKLDGKDQFLTVTDKNGGSLLTGVEEMTISYQINPSKSATNWGFFAAPNTNEQQYREEHYVGVVDINGKTNAERYNNNGARPEKTANYETGYPGWYHVTVVHTQDATKLYINGEKVSEAPSSYALSDILGENSVLYIGKSTWKTGEYATAMIDNYKILSKALTDEEVAEEASKYVEQKVNKDALQEAVENAIPEADADKYVHDGTWTYYQSVLKKAKEVLADENATQNTVDAVAKELTETQKKLTKVTVDKAELDKEIEDAITDEEKGNYTAQSWEAYQAALAEAKKVAADKNATQAEINAAVEALKAAEKALKPVEEEPVELPYEDVVENDWFYDAVAYNREHGYMRGKDDTHFAPLENLARAQFAVILHRIEGEPEVEYQDTFQDVADGEWYTDAILWASGAGIVTGYTDSGLFGTADNINREQMAVMMYRYAQYKKYDTDEKADFSKFEDADKVNAFAIEAMQWAVGTGIITGKYEGTQIDPQGSALRGECAIIIQRFMEYYQK